MAVIEAVHNPSSTKGGMFNKKNLLIFGGVAVGILFLLKSQQPKQAATQVAINPADYAADPSTAAQLQGQFNSFGDILSNQVQGNVNQTLKDFQDQVNSYNQKQSDQLTQSMKDLQSKYDNLQNSVNNLNTSHPTATPAPTTPAAPAPAAQSNIVNYTPYKVGTTTADLWLHNAPNTDPSSRVRVLPKGSAWKVWGTNNGMAVVGDNQFVSPNYLSY